MTNDLNRSYFNTSSQGWLLWKAASIFNKAVCTACVCGGARCMCVGVIINNQWKKSLKPRPLDSFKAAREPLLLPPIHLPSPIVLSSSGSQSIFFFHNSQQASIHLNYLSEGFSCLTGLQCLLESNQIRSHKEDRKFYSLHLRWILMHT